MGEDLILLFDVVLYPFYFLFGIHIIPIFW